MITNFEELTTDLTLIELEVVPLLVSELRQHSREFAIKSPQLVDRVKELMRFRQIPTTSFTGVRLRKLINYIRATGRLPVIATSRGYYVSFDKEEVEKQIQSLQERANAIIQSADGMKKFLNYK